jgi:hypothetical protein
MQTNRMMSAHKVAATRKKYRSTDESAAASSAKQKALYPVQRKIMCASIGGGNSCD